MVIAAWVRRKPVRKWFWTLGSLGQALSVAAMAASVWFLNGYSAGYGLIVALILFSLSRGFCSVSMKDVQGKCIPKTRRGRLSGLASTLGGTATVALTALLFWDRGDPSMAFYSLLLLLAAALWLIAGALFAGVEEYPGETGGGGNAIHDAISSLSLAENRQTVPPLCDYPRSAAVLCPGRTVFRGVGSTANRIRLGIGVFLLASSLASSLSASFWGWAADTSSRKVMIRGALMASMVCLGVAGYRSGNGRVHGRRVVLSRRLFCAQHCPRRRKAWPENLSGGYGGGQQTHRLHRGQQHRYRCFTAGNRSPDRTDLNFFRILRLFWCWGSWAWPVRSAPWA